MSRTIITIVPRGTIVCPFLVFMALKSYKMFHVEHFGAFLRRFVKIVPRGTIVFVGVIVKVVLFVMSVFP